MSYQRLAEGDRIGDYQAAEEERKWAEQQSGNGPDPHRAFGNEVLTTTSEREALKGRLYGVDEAERFALRAEVLGIPGPGKGPGACPLPGHDGHEAVLYDLRGGPKGGRVWRLRCEEQPPEHEHGIGLGEVLAARRYFAAGIDDCDGLTTVEISRWNELLDYRAGLLIPVPVDVHLPADVSSDGVTAIEQMRLLLGLRIAAGIDRCEQGLKERWIKGRDRFVFARRFARARTGLSDDRVRVAVEQVRNRRVIVQVGTAGRAYVYRFGSFAEVARG